MFDQIFDPKQINVLLYPCKINLGCNDMTVGYIRVSTVEQNEIRQKILMEDKGIYKLFIDKCSGKNTNRPKIKELMEFVREGDTDVKES